MGPQIEILRGANPANPLWSYVGELLAIEGYTYRMVDAPSGSDRLLIVPNLLLTDAQKEGIREHAQNGGAIIALRPPLDLAPLFGVQGRPNRQWFTGYTRHVDGDWLQIHGGADCYELAGAEAVTHLFPSYGSQGGKTPPAIVRAEEGGSRRACFAYDLARCCVLIQQGRPDQASDGPLRNADGDWKFSQNDMFVGHLDPRLKYVPQSDLHRDLLVRMILWVTEKTKPIPRVWRFPNAETAGAMIDGDGDSAPRELFDLAFDTCEEFGVPFSTYLMDDQFETITPADAKALKKRGHSVGYHPWLGPFPTPSEFEEFLKKAYGKFRDHYGYVPSATRNHCIIWTGWVDLPRVESEIGVRIDLNGDPVLGHQSAVLSGTLLPVKFMDGEGKLIDIYSQYTVHADDCLVEDKCGLPALNAKQLVNESQKWIDISMRHQGVYHPTFHPIRLQHGPPTIEWLRETLAYLKSRGVRGWSADGWAQFNDARRTVSIAATQTGWTIESERTLPGATIILPVGAGGVKVDDASIQTTPMMIAGTAQCAVTFDLKAKQKRTLTLRGSAH